MASRGHSAKKKKDTQIFKPQEESKDPKVDEAIDGQVNTFAMNSLKKTKQGLSCS